MPPLDTLLPPQDLLDENLVAVDAGIEAPIQPLEEDKDFITEYLKDKKDELFTFSKARTKLNHLVTQWNDEVKKTEQRRLERDVDIDVEELRASGKLDEDETLVPDRVIDTNIQREQPPYINYLKNSRRLGIFTCLSNPDQVTQRLELEFTQGMTYISWETAHFKTLDGTQTHGWDAVEIVFDLDKPLHAGIEQIGHDKLFFPKSCLDLQTAPFIVRAFDVTVVTLLNFVKNFGFDKKQVEMVISKVKDGINEPETIRIYKKYCKYEGQVYVSWFSLTDGCDDWLKAPIPLFLGISHKVKVTKMVDQIDPMTGVPTQVPQEQEEWKDTPITQYPIFIQFYKETEKQQIIEHKGRVFYDKYKQEAQTAILSGFINGLTRASSMFASVGAEDGSGSAVKEIQGLKLTGGRILDKPVNFWHPDYPDPMVIKSLQYLDVSNDQEVGQLNFAATNRQDSRKTAKEISASQEQQQLLNSVQLTMFSTHIRSIYSLVWLIVQSQALQGAIKFLLIPKQRPVNNPITSSPVIDMNTGQPQLETYYENDFETIKQVYDVRAAGDVDVIQKSEKVAQMKQDWPVISQTPLALPFLAEMLRLQYPDTGEKWAGELLKSGTEITNLKAMVNSLAQVIMGMAKTNPEMVKALPPQDKQQLMMLMKQAQEMSGDAAQHPEGEPNAQPSQSIQ